MATKSQMFARASNAADRAAARQAASDRLTAWTQAPVGEDGETYILDHYQETAMSSNQKTPWQNADLFKPGQMDWIVKRAKELGRTVHYAVIDTSSRPADHWKNAEGYRGDLSSNHTNEKTYGLRLRDHSSLIHQQLFHPDIGVLYPLVKEKLCTWSLHRIFTEVGYSSKAWIMDSLRHVLSMDHGADLLVVNMSFGAMSKVTDSYDAIFNPVQDKPVLLFASAGNSGEGTGDTVMVPARCKGVTSIAAYDYKQKRADFSSVGPDVDLIGPGHKTPTYDRDGKLVEWSGTSSSGPLVAAQAACIGLVIPELATQRTMHRALLEYADDLGTAGRDNFYGNGLVNVADFIVDMDPPAPPPPAAAMPEKILLRGATITPANREEGRKLVKGETAVVTIEGWLS